MYTQDEDGRWTAADTRAETKELKPHHSRSKMSSIAREDKKARCSFYRLFGMGFVCVLSVINILGTNVNFLDGDRKLQFIHNVTSGSPFDHISGNKSYFDRTTGRHDRPPLREASLLSQIEAVAVPSTRAWNEISPVFSCQELKVAKEPPSTLNFLASAVGRKYEDLLPMYVFYALSAHRKVDAVAEIIVPDANAFVGRHQKALDHLQITFSSPSHPAICVREYTGQPSKRTKVTNTWRYLEVPSRFSAKYTYIGDIDVFLTESVLDSGRFQQMNEFNLSYSNIVRDYDKEPRRLTGLMLIETSRFYTEELLQAQAKLDARGNDEAFLYNIVEAAGLGIPPRNSTLTTYLKSQPLVSYRPAHGVHVSFNRGPGKRMCKGIRLDRMLEVEGLEEYRRHDSHMDAYLSEVQSDLEEEKREDMIVFNDKCQPRRNQKPSNSSSQMQMEAVAVL